ncbi:fructokinase [Thermocatellispora tengchongensis]|uniref:Fructokinase n=1 Tax=Thermocatellispora tengchongensis TaxID=1073253 RepID=A0A840PEZ5_9ACTN|nr:carbohydrate kinase [Thermocatellispora tengchongensis]MBB5137336.1 fructokinase [Thermocatellispora tengchongensis]
MTFLVIGESIVDLIGSPGAWRFSAVPGGSPLNVAVALATLGQPVRFASEIGGDFFGELLRDHLGRHGVGHGDLVPGGATSLAFARIGADGSASYDFRFDWRFSGPVSLDGVTCLHTGSLATLAGPGAAHVREVMQAAAQSGVVVSYDPNIRPSLIGDREPALKLVEECVRLSRLVKVSAEDLAWLYPGEPDLDAATRWAAWPGERLVVVTQGGDGATAILGDTVITCPAPVVDLVDTVGAGDTFTAAYLAVLGDGEFTVDRVRDALRRGCAAAAVVCTREGAAPPSPQEIDGLLSSVSSIPV